MVFFVFKQRCSLPTSLLVTSEHHRICGRGRGLSDPGTATSTVVVPHPLVVLKLIITLEVSQQGWTVSGRARYASEGSGSKSVSLSWSVLVSWTYGPKQGCGVDLAGV